MTHAIYLSTVEAHHLFFRGSLQELYEYTYLIQKLFFKEKKKVLPDEKSHGSSKQRKILQHKNYIPTIFGHRAPVIQKTF